MNGTVVLILFTCIVASFATEKAGKTVVRDIEDNEGPDLQKGIKTEQILIPIANLVNIDEFLEFAVLIKDQNSINPLTILTVVPNNHEAEKKIIKAKQEMEKFISETTASDTQATVKATIDHNPASGISRSAREIMADIILLGWPQKTGFFDKLLGDKMGSILENTNKTLFFADFRSSLANHKALFVIAPNNTEYEDGFGIWISKLAKLSAELSIPINLNSTKETHEAIVEFAKSNKIALTLDFHEFNDWDDFLILGKHISDNDFIIMISARRGYISHFGQLDGLPSKLEKHFSNNSKMIIYPE